MIIGRLSPFECICLARYDNAKRLTYQGIINVAKLLSRFTIIIWVGGNDLCDMEPHKLREVLKNKNIPFSYVHRLIKYLLPLVLKREFVGIWFDINDAWHATQNGCSDHEVIVQMAMLSMNNFPTKLPGGSRRLNSWLDFEYKGETFRPADEFQRIKKLFESGQAFTLEALTDSRFARALREMQSTSEEECFRRKVEVEQAVDETIRKLNIDPREVCELTINKAKTYQFNRVAFSEFILRVMYSVYRELLLSGKFPPEDLYG